MEEPDALQQVLDETRQRFIATFVVQRDSIRTLVDKVAARGKRGPVATLRKVTHQLSGLDLNARVMRLLRRTYGL